MAQALGIGGAFMKADNPKELADWYVSTLRLGEPQHHGTTGSFGLPFNPKDLPPKAYVQWSVTPRDSKHYRSDFMFNFIVDDIDGAISQIQQAGGEILRRDFVVEGVGKFAWFRDPEGNQMELWEPEDF